MQQKPIIAIAGLACECSTFTPALTSASAFHPKRGPEILSHYAFLQPGTELGDSAVWAGALIGHALPGGRVEHSSFQTLMDEILSRLRQIIAEHEHLDGLWLDIHGALYVDGMHDAEAELLRQIRTVIGPDVLVSASMDLHGNVSEELVHQADLITCYRTAPHVDVLETKQRACRNLLDLLSRPEEQRRPLKAWIPIPILLPGEQTSTRDEPAKSLYDAVPAVEAATGVLDATVWVGYAWADEARSRAVVVVTGFERDAVKTGAEKLARLFWMSRRDFKFVAPTGSLEECLDAALASKTRPFFISDSGDNPTAGGTGDVTWSLTRILARSEFQDKKGPTVIYASIPGPEAVRIAVEAGEGATVTVTAGAEIDHLHAPPVTMTGRIFAIKHGDRHAGIEVVLQVSSVFVIITQRRKPYHLERDFTELKLAPREADLVVVKIGYLEPELYAMANDWMLALTPGGVDQDLIRLGHTQIRRPMWPFNTEFEAEPDLSARFVSSSNRPLDSTELERS